MNFDDAGVHEPGMPTLAGTPLARVPVLSAMAVVAVLLTGLSERYGFHRDELYFRSLSPAWGYVDQPPLTPLLAQAAARVSDSPWVSRVPATACAVVSLLVLVLVTRELGGGRGAQTLCAWGYAFAAIPLVVGHVLLTASLDLVVWPLTCLFVIKALLGRERWWLASGIVIGLSTYNKLLVAVLVLALLGGLLIAGPRRMLRSRWLWLAAVVAVVLALPNLIYQATHSWPQLTMAAALSRHNGGSVRVLMWPYLALLLGPPLVPIWVAGLVGLWRRPAWRRLRLFVPAFALVLVATFLGGAQLYYPMGLLTVLFAVGCVPAGELLARSRRWRVVTAVGLSINALVSSVIALPLLSAEVLAESPVPSINQTAGDQVGWPDYVRQIAAVYGTVAGPTTAIVTSNYGEYGATVQYGPSLHLPRPYSGHNQLYFDASPAADTNTVVMVGGQYDNIRGYFATCTVVARLHNRYGVANEEEGKPIAICHRPTQAWNLLWPRFLHYD